MLQFIKSLQDRKAENGEEGFTLIELLIVIVVLGILAAVVVFTIGNVTSQSAQTACQADAKSVETAVAAYNAQNGSAIGLEASKAAAIAGGIGSQQVKLIPTYLNAWPSNASHYVLALAYTTVSPASIGTAGQVIVWPAANGTVSTTTAGQVYDTESAGNGCLTSGM